MVPRACYVAALSELSLIAGRSIWSMTLHGVSGGVQQAMYLLHHQTSPGALQSSEGRDRAPKLGPTLIIFMACRCAIRMAAMVPFSLLQYPDLVRVRRELPQRTRLPRSACFTRLPSNRRSRCPLMARRSRMTLTTPILLCGSPRAGGTRRYGQRRI